MNCIICGNNNWRHIFFSNDKLLGGREIFEVKKCSKCGIYKTFPEMDFYQLIKYYPKEYPCYNQSKIDVILKNFSAKKINGYKEKIKKTLGEIKYRWIIKSEFQWINLLLMTILRKRWLSIIPYPQKQEKILLEIGYGNGKFLLAAYQNGWECVGIDIEDKIGKKISKYTKIKIIKGMAEEVSFKKESFDFIYASHVLEHSLNPLLFLNNIYKWLKPEGIVCIKIPIVSFLEKNILGKFNSVWDIPRHRYHFTKKTIKNLLYNCGFSNINFINEPNMNNWIWGLRWFLKEKNFKLYYKFDINNNYLQKLLIIPSSLLAILSLSGRCVIYATKIP